MNGTHKEKYSYSISGNPGALGGMLFSEGMAQLRGTWYDRTSRTAAFCRDEVNLGLSKHASPRFRRMAKRTALNMKNPPEVDVDIHFRKAGAVETIKISGKRGTRSFRFDLDQARKQKLPKGADPFKPINDAITKIIRLIKSVR